MNSYIVIDIEATGNVNVQRTRIIEIALVRVDNGEITLQYSTFINPQISISPFITSLTGIRDEDVKFSPTFLNEAKKIKEMIADHTIVGHNVLFDVRFLNKEFERIGMNHLKNQTIDTVELTKITFPTIPYYNLGDIAEYLKLSHESPHRALSDAIVTSELFIKLKEKLFNLPLQTKNHLRKMTDIFHSDLENMLDQSLKSTEKNTDFVTFNGLTFNNVFHTIHKEHNPINGLFGPLMDSIYGENGTLLNYFPHYEHRNNQRMISEQIYDSFRSNNHTLIESETGTGKTLAYLIPALYEAVKNNDTIVISTEKVNLQTQLLEDELPKLKGVLPFVFTYTLLKGRSHYLCLKSFHKRLNTTESNYNKNILKAMILVWITETETGDINELNLPQGTLRYIKGMSAIKETHHSPWFKYSYHRHAYEKARNAHIIIVNHALLSTDLHLQNNLIPSYNKVIIDEAHHFPDIAAEQFSLMIDFQYVFKVLNKLSLTEFSNRYFQKPLYKLRHTLNELYQYILRLLMNSNDNESLVIVNHLADDRTWPLIVEMINRVVNMMEQIFSYIKNDIENNNNKDIYIFEQIKNKFKHLSDISIINNHVISFEKNHHGNDHNIFINMEQVCISSYLETNLFSKKNSVILISATLTVQHSFTYFINRIGLEKFNPIKKIFKSPFNINEQAKLMVPNDFPSVDHEDFIYVASEIIYSLSHTLNRNILVLFTSHQMLKTAYHLLDEVIGLQYNLIAQNITHQNNIDLINEFKTKCNCILLGTSSLWEGIDVPSENIGCLIIVKLPFENPYEFKHKIRQRLLEEQGKSGFYHYILPRMIIRLKQGMGRLIRSKSDKGVIFILDDRIITSSYSDYIMSSIKHYPLIYNSSKFIIEKAKKWIK